MGRKAMRCRAELTVHAVTCPGVWLPYRDDVYISVSMFGQTRRSLLTSPVFPLLFHQKFNYDKVFYTAYTPSHVTSALESHWVTIELVQLNPDPYAPGHLLASWEGSVRDFLYPYPSYTCTYGTTDREVLLERSLDFPGISPKLEFSTKTVIEESLYPYVTEYDYEIDTPRIIRSASRSRGRSRSRSRSRRLTASRARSISPSRRLAKLLDSDSSDNYATKPPFVVRKCDSGKLIGRVPGSPEPLSHGYSRKRRSSLPLSTSLDYEMESLSLTPRSRSPFRATNPYYYSPRALSPGRRSYYDRMYSDLVSERVDRALENNYRRRLEEEASERYYDALTDMELDLALARARARRSLIY